MSSDGPTRSYKELEDDRQALRVQVFPSVEISPIRAAWQLGRLCNEMRFRLESAWILSRDGEPGRTAQSWEDAEALIRRIFGGQHVDATDALQAVRDFWEQAFSSEWHSDDLHGANRMLDRHLCEGESLPYGGSELDLLVNVSASVTENFRQLTERIATGMPAESRSAFRLGQIADELIHPALNSRGLRIIRVTENSNERRWSDAGARRSNFTNRTLLLPNGICQPWPDIGWRQRVSHYFAEFCLAAEPERVPRTLPWTARTRLSQMLDDLEATVDGAEFDTTQPTADQEPGGIRLTRRGQRFARRLGLTIDDSNHRLVSQVCITPTPIPPRLFRLLVHFLNQGDEPTTAQWIGENYGLFNPTRPSLPLESVHTAINQLNGLLYSHDLEVERGYRLVRIRLAT